MLSAEPSRAASCAIDSIKHARPASPRSASDDTLTLTVKARLQRVGREMRMLVENADGQTSADPGLLRIIARAHDFHQRLMQRHRSDRARHRQPGAPFHRLHLSPFASAFAGTRHHHRHRQRQKPASTHGEEADAIDCPYTRRLDRTAKAAWVSGAIGRAFRTLRRDLSDSRREIMLTPKCRPRDIRVRARANSTKESSLPLEGI